MKHSIFLDADGVLWPDIGPGGLLNGMVEANMRLTKLIETLRNREEIFIGVVTNQTFAARGEMPYRDFKEKVFSLFDKLKNDMLIDDYRVCFHHPNAEYLPLRIIDCGCRKPQSGMIDSLISQYSLLPDRSIIIGDRITDVLAGKNARIDSAVLLLGNRMLEMNQSAIQGVQGQIIPFKVARDFLESLEILKVLILHD
jgi:D-glycero-D-manno-heptose 1,7-bisphosphate phosphatase